MSAKNIQHQQQDQAPHSIAQRCVPHIGRCNHRVAAARGRWFGKDGNGLRARAQRTRIRGIIHMLRGRFLDGKDPCLRENRIGDGESALRRGDVDMQPPHGGWFARHRHLRRIDIGNLRAIERSIGMAGAQVIVGHVSRRETHIQQGANRQRIHPSRRHHIIKKIVGTNRLR